MEYIEKVRMKAGKPRFELIDPLAELGLAMVLGGGAIKYGEGAPWKGLHGSDRMPVYGALIRHYNAMMVGETIDTEFLLPHSVHLLANAMFLAGWDMAEVPIHTWMTNWKSRVIALAESRAPFETEPEEPPPFI